MKASMIKRLVAAGMAVVGMAAVAAAGPPEGSRPTVGAHYSGFAPVVRDHRTPPVIMRDHWTPPVIVRDHRIPPVVRDHRAPVVLRDHRTPWGR
jgi:hypothetical protein